MRSVISVFYKWEKWDLVKYLIWSLKSVIIYLIKCRNQYRNSSWVGCKNHLPNPILFYSSIYQNACQEAPSFKNVCLLEEAIFICLLLIRYAYITDNQIIWLLCWVDIISAKRKDLVLVGLCFLTTSKFRLFWIIKNSLCTGTYLVQEMLNEFKALIGF